MSRLIDRLTDEQWGNMFKLIMAGCAPPGKGDDEDAVRYRAETEREERDDREWVARRIERAGAYFGGE